MSRLVAETENSNGSCRAINALSMVVFPQPDGADNMITLFSIAYLRFLFFAGLMVWVVSSSSSSQASV